MPRVSRQKKRAAASADTSDIAVGDIILASHAGQWDADDLEPAQVLQLGCEYTVDDNDDETHNDGMLVKFQVSNTRVVVPGPSSVRRPEEAVDTTVSSGRRSRSSSRASRSQTAASPKTTETTKKTTAKNTTRGLVTPSPSLGTAAAASSSGDDEEGAGMDKEPPKKRGRSVDTIQTTPTKKKRGVSKAKGTAKVEDDEASKVESPYFAKAKKPKDDDNDDDDDGDEMLGELKIAEPKVAKKRKALVRKNAANKDDKNAVAKKKSTKAAAKKKAAPKKKSKVVVVADSDSDDDDDDDPDDKPFKAEYAATGRATCRRCDTLIGKGELRISHVPLFRGKPGYRVYRHLPCAVFDENIQCVEDIGGWKKIQRKSQEDFDNLIRRVEDSKEEVKKEQEELRPDELVQVTFQGETRAPPPGLTANLLPFQTEGVSWMYHQEVKVPELHGGILADEMGMGKTLQTITTILDNRCKLQHSKPGAKHPPNMTSTELEDRSRESNLWDASLEEWKHEMNMVNVPKKMWSGKKQLGLRAGTLVICPVIAVTQWKTEIEKFTDGCLTIATYHGPNRAKELPLQKLIKYDIVITTYQVLEQDFRKMVSPNKVTCPNCGGKYKAEKLRVHLKYFCGDGAQKTEAQARQQRTAVRPNNRGGGGGGGKVKKGGFKKKEFPKTTSTKKATKSSTAIKQKGTSKPTAAARRDKHLGTKVANIFGAETYFGEVTTARTTDEGLDLYQVTYSDGDQEELELAEILAANQRYQAAQASKPPATKQKSRSKAKGKNIKKAAASKQVESSDSEEEEEEVETLEISPTTGRPSRSAALTASKIMSASMKEWTTGDTKGADDDSFGDDGGGNSEDSDDSDESAISYDEEDSEGEAIPSPAAKKKAAPKKKQSKKTPDSDSEDSELESSDDEAALVRVRKRQEAALAQATKGKGGKKSFTKKGRKSHAKGKKKKFDDDDESSEDESDDEDRDPLEGIDLEELMKEAMEGSQMSLLHSVCWWRVVLDEAHMIKSRSSQTAAAAFSLIGVNRWALSGTPLQNRVGELYSLIRFLRIDPMAHYFCRSKGCGCKGIHYRIKNGKCQDCHHGGIQHFSHFNKHVLNPIQRDGYSGDGRLAMFKLKEEVLDKCLLRRTKETRAEDMNLPPRIVSIRTIQLHPIEKDFYDALYTQTKSSFSDYVARGTLLNNYAHIFDLLTRMRQAVDHPYLIVYSKRQMERDALAAGGTEQAQIANGSTDCDICHEPPMGRVCSSCCGAAFCRSCVIEYMTPALEGVEDAGGTPCPSCRSPFSIDLNQADTVVDDSPVEDSPVVRRSSSSPKSTSDTGNDFGPSLKELANVNSGSILRRINLAEFATSTKIEALVQELVSMRKESPGSKALVFSQFVNMLDLIRWRIHCDPCLSEMGLGVRILHGSMDRKARDAALKDFKEDKSIRVLLMSLKSGGVALNLTVASHVFLVDNWWNPAAEMQAIDRTHRLGQHRCIRAVRFIAEGTVEERVLQLQEKKRLVFDGTVGRDAGSLKMLTSDDMASLFT